MLNWSPIKIKFTSGIGCLCLTALLAEAFNKQIPVWIVIAIVILPLAVFVSVTPENFSIRIVTAAHVAAAIWFLITATFGLIAFLTLANPAKGWPLLLIGIALGAFPCLVVLQKFILQSKMQTDAKPNEGASTPEIQQTQILLQVPSTGIIYPATILLRAGIARRLILTATAAMFVAIGWWMIQSGNWFGWLGVIFFSLCACAGVVNCLPGASGMLVMPQGFAIRTFFRVRFYPWQHVHDFGVWQYANTKVVVFHSTGPCRRKAATLSLAISGFTDCHPETYGLPPETLASALTAYRQAALANAERPDLTT